MTAGDPFDVPAAPSYSLPWMGDCPTCHGLGRVYRAPAHAPDLEVGHVDFGRDYACPRCTPARYNVERSTPRYGGK